MKDVVRQVKEACYEYFESDGLAGEQTLAIIRPILDKMDQPPLEVFGAVSLIFGAYRRNAPYIGESAREDGEKLIDYLIDYFFGKFMDPELTEAIIYGTEYIEDE